MFSGWFYNQRIKRSVAMFGRLFNNLYVIRKDSNGQVISQVKVPLAYAPKRKYIERILEQPELPDDTNLAIKLPRMSFEILTFAYDPSFQSSKMSTFGSAGSTNTTRSQNYIGIPYNINFQLNIYAKSHDDALQVVEQIIPYFAPQYNLAMKPFDDQPTVTEDNPVILQGISFSDDYEGALEDRRTIIYSLDFEMKVKFYGPVNESAIIREIDVNLWTIGVDSDNLISNINIVPDPLNVSPDSDFGFTTTITNYVDSA